MPKQAVSLVEHSGQHFERAQIDRALCIAPVSLASHPSRYLDQQFPILRRHFDRYLLDTPDVILPLDFSCPWLPVHHSYLLYVARYETIFNESRLCGCCWFTMGERLARREILSADRCYLVAIPRIVNDIDKAGQPLEWEESF